MIQQNKGTLTYPKKLPNGSRQKYPDRESCVWQIQSGSPKKWLKVSFLFLKTQDL